MVDFQSRDTKRGLDDEEDDETDVAGTDAGGTAEDSDGNAGMGTDAETPTPATEAGDEQAGVSYALVTVAAGRTFSEDETGEAVADAIESTGGTVVTRELVTPSYDGIQTAVARLVDREDVEALVTVGGTGVEPTDVTVDAVEDLLDRVLPGFGELFRALAHDQVGTAVVRTRAMAGLIDQVPVFCLPGTPSATRLGLEEIVLDEAGDIVTRASETDEQS